MARRAWLPSSFTQPKQHTDTKFRYVVHGLYDYERMNVSDRRSRLLENPTEIKSERVLSVSVIDEQHSRTYGFGGYVLSVPAANVFAAARRDIGSAKPKTEEAATKERTFKFRWFGLPSPSSLLDKTGNYNEVLIAGNSPEGSVKISGVFAKKLNGEWRDTPTRIAHLQSIARKLDVPFITLNDRD